MGQPGGSEMVDVVFDQPGTLGISFEEVEVPVAGGSHQSSLMIGGILPGTQAASKPQLHAGCAFFARPRQWRRFRGRGGAIGDGRRLWKLTPNALLLRAIRMWLYSVGNQVAVGLPRDVIIHCLAHRPTTLRFVRPTHVSYPSRPSDAGLFSPVSPPLPYPPLSSPLQEGAPSHSAPDCAKHSDQG